MLSMALCWLLGDPDRRAPRGLKYLALLWQEDLPGEPSKRIIWAWLPMLDLGAEAAVSWNMFIKSYPQQLTRCGFGSVGSQTRYTGIQPIVGSPQLTFSVVLNYNR